jgi:hypothetical protein
VQHLQRGQAAGVQRELVDLAVREGLHAADHDRTGHPVPHGERGGQPAGSFAAGSDQVPPVEATAQGGKRILEDPFGVQVA